MTPAELEALRADMARFCDACDALLTDAERAAGERHGQTLCDACAAAYASAEPVDAEPLPWDDDDPPPRHRGWGLRFTDQERDDFEGMED